MTSRRAITKAQAVRYPSASRAGKSQILDLVCAVTGFDRDYAGRALNQAVRPWVVKARALRPPKYDAKVVAALQKCWAVVNAPAGKRLAPILAELVPLLKSRIPMRTWADHGRGLSGLCGDRLGRSRGRQLARGVLLHPHRD